MIVTRLNESYSVIDDNISKLQEMFEYLKVERHGAWMDPLVKAGFKSPYEYFGSIQHNKLLVLNGHLELLKSFGIQTDKKAPEFTRENIQEFLVKIKKTLPFEPYDFQEKAFIESVLNYKQINKMCTGSGKSLTISLMAEFFRQNNMKGILLVPNINLLTQFKNDIKDYNLIDLYEDTHVIGGGQTERHFNNSLTISTWQSLQDLSMVNLDELDYVICDECLHPDTLITTIEGDKKIIDIKPGDIVLTINEETKEREWKKVIKRHKNLGISRNEKMLNIKMEDGRELKITGNHKVQTQRGWVRADELTVDDDIISL